MTTTPLRDAPRSITLRIGRRRLTVTFRPRKRIAELLAKLLVGAWRAIFGLGRLALAGASGAALAAGPTPPANILPAGAQLAAGQASISQTANAMTVLQSSDKAILNWNSFNIGSNASVTFQQPNAASVALNRVTSNEPSQLLGSLSGNGKVWLVNPAGIMVGQGARIDLHGFVASTLAMRDEDFLAGRMNFRMTPNAGAVQNYGSITTRAGGSVYLVAPNVENHGIINAPNGEVILAAGQTVELLDTATPGVKVEITGAVGNVTNLGAVMSEAGRIGMAGVLVRNSGTLNASSVVSEGGRIFLRAKQDSYIDKAARVSASGSKGGTIEILGERVAVQDQAQVDASGTNGGGTILVGGDAHGDNPAVPNARMSYIGPDVTLRADATGKGDGGKVIVWADQQTQFYGTIFARGGQAGGDGGFVETSGKEILDANGHVNASAPAGKGGQWLLDPNNVSINDSGSTSHIHRSSDNKNDSDIDNIADGSNVNVKFFESTGDSATINASTLSQALADNTTVTVRATTSGGSSQHGDITVNGTVTATGASATLRLDAQGDIYFTSSGHLNNKSGGILNVQLNAGEDSSFANPGTNASVISMASGSTIATGGGYVTGTAQNNVTLAGITAGAGSITVNSTGGALTLGGTLSSSASGNAVVLGGTSFVNNVGSSAINVSGGGRWLVYSATPASNTFGSLASGNAPIWGTSYGSSVSASGNRYVFSSGATVTLTPASVTKAYGTDLSAFAPGYTLSGTAVDAATYGNVYTAASASDIWTTLPSFSSAGTAASAGVSGGPYTISASGGTANSGYTVSFGSGALTVTPVALTVTANAASKTYDGNAYSGGNGVAYSGFVNGESSTVLGGSLSYGGSAQGATNAGTYAITPRGLTSTNYTLAFADGVLTINPASLNVISLSGTRAYDGTNVVNAGIFSLSGLIGSQTLVLSGAGTVADKNVGSNKTVTLGTLALGDGSNGGLANNYTLTGGTHVASITPKALTASVSAPNKVYDGSTSATPTLTITSGLVGNETLAASGSASFNSKDVATANLVTVNSVNLADGSNGGLASNYSLASGQTTAAAITAKTLTASVSAPNKVYDGSTSATPTLTITGGLVGSETVTPSGSASFNSKDVATANLVTVNSVSLANGSNGGLASNYSLASGQTTAAAITAKALTASASAPNKVYDGSTSATATLTITGGLVGSETVTPSGSASFNSKDVATANLVTVNSTTLADGSNGGKASNYSLASGQTAVANITPAPLMVTAASKSKTYDGNVYSGGYTVGYDSFVNGETSSVLGGSLSFGGSAITATNAGTYTIVPSGLTSNNYSITFTNGSLTISSAPLTVISLNGTRTYDGTNIVNAGIFTLSGLVGNQTLNLTGSGLMADKNVGVNKPVTLNSLALANGSNGGLASNYTLTGGTYVATITPANVTIGTGNISKTYDGGLSAIGTPVAVSGTIFTGDSLSGGTYAFTDKNVGAGNKTVNVSAVTINDGNNGANYNVSYQANTASTITRLASVAWTGGATGNWSNAANWDGGALPDAANVAAVTIPSGSTVTYDAGMSGTTSLVSLSSAGNVAIPAGTLAVSGNAAVSGSLAASGSANVALGTLSGSGTLSIGGSSTVSLGAGNSTIGALTQSGGALAVNGALAVTNAFSQSAGTLTVSGGGLLGIEQVSGPLVTQSITTDGALALTAHGASITLGNTRLSAAAGNLNVNANGGAVTQGSGATLYVGGTTAINAGAAAINVGNVGNDFFGGVSLNNTGANNITIRDPNTLQLAAMNIGSGVTSVIAGGAVSQSGGVVQEAGGVLDVQAVGGVTLGAANQIKGFRATNTGSGNVVLINTANPLTTGIITTPGSVTIDNTGGVVVDQNLTAGTHANVTAHSPVTVNATISAPTGIDLAASTDVTLSATAVLSSTTGAVTAVAGGSIIASPDARVTTSGGSAGTISLVAAGAITAPTGVFNGATPVISANNPNVATTQNAAALAAAQAAADAAAKAAADSAAQTAAAAAQAAADAAAKAAADAAAKVNADAAAKAAADAAAKASADAAAKAAADAAAKASADAAAKSAADAAAKASADAAAKAAADAAAKASADAAAKAAADAAAKASADAAAKAAADAAAKASADAAAKAAADAAAKAAADAAAKAAADAASKAATDAAVKAAAEAAAKAAADAAAQAAAQAAADSAAKLAAEGAAKAAADALQSTAKAAADALLAADSIAKVIKEMEAKANADAAASQTATNAPKGGAAVVVDLKTSDTKADAPALSARAATPAANGLAQVFEQQTVGGGVNSFGASESAAASVKVDSDAGKADGKIDLASEIAKAEAKKGFKKSVVCR